jgi:hypothetical protein
MRSTQQMPGAATALASVALMIAMAVDAARGIFS